MEREHNYLQILTQLIYATNRIDGAYYFRSKKSGLNENKYAVLYALSENKAYTQKQLSEEWLIPKTTINTVIKELQQEEIICFILEPHKKEKVIALTEKGKEYVERILGDTKEIELRVLEETVEKYSPAFVEALTYFAEHIQEAFEKEGTT